MMNIVSQKVVTTRKLHNCWGCTKEIPVGTKTQTVTSEDGGQIAKVYWCDKCNDILDKLPIGDFNNGFAYGELKALEGE